jgi:hypothetical protein
MCYLTTPEELGIALYMIRIFAEPTIDFVSNAHGKTALSGN